MTLNINGGIFTSQGKAIEANAASDVRILVVGNPCNTNCLIAMNNAPSIPKDRWFAMTMLDENRAKAQLAEKANQPITAISNMTIWGNHSATQYPDFYSAKINNKNASTIINDNEWLENSFIPKVQSVVLKSLLQEVLHLLLQQLMQLLIRLKISSHQLLRVIGLACASILMAVMESTKA